MADLVDILNRINIPTEQLQVAVIQEILLKARSKSVTENEEILWSKMLDILWAHLAEGFHQFDDQLLCATCFYTILNLTNKQKFYLHEGILLINNEILVRQNFSKPSLIKAETSRVVSLMYGMFQSTFVVHSCTENIPNAVQMIEVTVELLTLMSYEYSKYTFLVFKTISSFKKTLGTPFQETVYCKSNFIKLLNIVNHNWENPITGVRDLNKLIFRTVVGIIDKDMYGTVLNEINNFYWNKAKYLMLAEIVEQFGRYISSDLKKEWVRGIFYSLYKPGLVSAGTDMYFAVIKNLDSEEKWCNLFLSRCIEILNGKTSKAIENFANYWCLTTFKRFPQLVEDLINELLKFERSELNLYSCLCILKQGAKVGLINRKDASKLSETTEIFVLQGIEHANTDLRMLAFEIILNSHGKSAPSSADYDLILNYLESNINTDCTVLRISMLNNLRLFLGQLQGILYKDNNTNVDNLIKFYNRLQEFIIKSLNLNGNYQRKVTTIKACNIILSSFNNAPKKRLKKNNSVNVSSNILLKENGCPMLFEERFIMILFSLLKDPADDIRENTVQLLLSHYTKEMTPILINHLIDDAQTNIKSKFFFQINCGQSTFRLIASLLIKEEYPEVALKTLDDIFSLTFKELLEEYEMKRDIVKSIEIGKQTHSLLGVMLEVLKVAKLNSCEIVTLQQSLPQILEILDCVSNQFTWEEETSTNSDFSKMNDMIQNMIILSGYNPTDDKDYTKISGLQQIVLNCLWFNVKAACDFASFLIQFLNEEHISDCEKCINIVIHALETSRHKGVIEAAGAALGRAIQYLTSLSEGNRLSNVPFSLLQCKIKELISYANMASVTRRGAGLSIMVHRIVSSDMKKGKPLFHYFMKTILETCSKAIEIPNNLDESQKDLPKAIFIHFLTRIVTDSSLASDMMYYSVELAEIAFDNLKSSHWQIRNAALQLYGALIPKLIGQKKASGTDDETVATVACDEFRTHSSKLWEHMNQCLKNINNTEDKVQAHSNVMPILNVLANLARSYNFSFGTTTLELYDKELMQSLVTLLGSPIFTVRRLSAKSMFNIYNFDLIFQTVMEEDLKSENFLHGSLMLIVNCHKYYSSQNHRESFDELKQKFALIFNAGNHSYICKQLFEELLGEEHNIMFNIQETLTEMQRYSHTPGISHWAKSRVRKYIKHCSWEDIIEIIKAVSNERDFDDYCHLVFMKMESENVSNENQIAVGLKLLTLENISKSTMAWKILYQISLNERLIGNLPSKDIMECLKHKQVSYTMRYAIPYLATLADCLQYEQLVDLSNFIFTLCDPEKSDVEMRYIAVISNNELAKVLGKLPDSIKITALKSAIILLQDEDEDVRSMSTKFYNNLSKHKDLLHSYICLQKILDYQFLKPLFANSRQNILKLCDEISLVLNSYTKSVIDKYNPFASDSKNIYFEVEIVKQLLIQLKDI